MKALIVRKQCSRWLLAIGCWLTALAAIAETPLPHALGTPEENMACGLVCPPNIIVSTDPGLCGAMVTYTVNITDPGTCIGPLVQITGLPSGANFPVGVTLNSFEIQTVSLPETCSFTVTVQDNEAPVILNCPADMTANTDPGFCDAQVFWFLPNENDNCGVVSFGGTHNPGDIFPIGVTSVTYTATDPAGNNGVCTFNITVEDAEAPVITSCSPDIVVNSDPSLCSASVFWGPPTATDNCGVNSIMYSNIAGDMLFFPGDNFPVGTTPVVVVAFDAANNGDVCTFNIIVDDAEPPVLTCPDITVNNDPGACEAVVTISPTATDNCGIASVTSFPPSGSAFPWGTTTVNVTAIDNAGLPSFCSFTLTVQDTEGPIFKQLPY